MSLKYLLFPMTLITVVWSGYVMFDWYTYYQNMHDGVLGLVFPFVGGIMTIISGLGSYAVYNWDRIEERMS